MSVEPSASPNFDRDGFVIMNGFLETEELAMARDLVALVLQSPHEHACRRPHNKLFPLRWNDAVVQLFLDSTRRVHLLAVRAGADDLRWISAYVSVKEAHSPPLWWHQDWWCWDHKVSFQRASPQVAVLCYLTDTSTHDGALRVLPGSHHKSFPIHSLLPDANTNDVDALALTDEAMSDQPGQVTLSVEAGDAVLIDYRLLHGTHANSSDLRRDCIILNFTPSWRSLPEDIQGHLIRNLAQPSASEIIPHLRATVRLLPDFSGGRKDLALNRNAPYDFQVEG